MHIHIIYKELLIWLVVEFLTTLETRKQWSTVFDILREVFNLEFHAKPNYDLCGKTD